MSEINAPSLEYLVETMDLGLEILHPGGLRVTDELARHCHLEAGMTVLDVAAGTGETACYLVEQFGCQVIGLDVSPYMVDRAREKAKTQGLTIIFEQGSAHDLPFEDDAFDAVVSECTTCLLDKERAIREMVRVTKPGGYVGIHDICWQPQTPAALKQKLADLEGERPETLAGWQALFEASGLVEVEGLDRSYLIPPWMRETMAQLGLKHQMSLFFKIMQLWGLKGLWYVLESERIFMSKHTGYGIIVGMKP